ncbi:hypothetical protein [Candidatus Nitrospira allomarina]|jgi:hypothetical protein|uniref:Uncharacterized protein n=1 Tax=Candidatus Nitrospira allomarina TaxID=3020900 RepID=A0AA96JYZ0_9BACT|nr:hypothetical protein [Candidatus Nitrospira allomarina]WNM58049.1 hypothetical protein PP769_19085 [Candidatus Nitrospira allomarina]
MFVGTCALDSGSGIGQFKGKEWPLFRSEFSVFVNLVLGEPIT